MKKTSVLISLGAFVILFVGAFIYYERVRMFTFDDLMGKGSKYWKYVQKPGDFQDLDFYSKIYEKNKPLLKSKESVANSIPKVIHFIWLGPRPFPEQSIKNVNSWIHNHPGWKVKFWTDRETVLPTLEMEPCFLKDFSFAYLPGYLDKTPNYGEKSDMWRFEILYKEGGIYADHDVFCYSSFESLQKNFDFFVALEKPHHVPGFTTTIHPGICLIGAAPGHPILKRSMELVQECWEEAEQKWGHHRILKVMNRTFKSFGLAVRQEIDKENRRDIILPASYFFGPEIFSGKTFSLLKRHHLALAKHLWNRQWQLDDNANVQLESRIQKMEKQLEMLPKQNEKFFFIHLSLLGLIFVLLALSLKKKHVI